MLLAFWSRSEARLGSLPDFFSMSVPVSATQLMPFVRFLIWGIAMRNHSINFSYIFILSTLLLLFSFIDGKEIHSLELIKDINKVQDIGKTSRYNENIGFVNQVKGLNLRAEASRQSTIKTLLPLFSKVSILDENGPLEKIISKSGQEISGKWFKVRFNDFTGWIFGPYLTVLNNGQCKRKRPNFNKMKLQLNSRAICCDCGPYINKEEIIFSNRIVTYTRIYGNEESKKIIQEGTYSIKDKVITIQLKEGTISNYDVVNNSEYGSTTEKAPKRTLTIEWHDELKGFITTDMTKYLKDDNYVINILDSQFVKVHGLIDNDLCIRNFDYQDHRDYSHYLLENKMNNGEFLNGYYFEKTE
jgi:hypothetical protein